MPEEQTDEQILSNDVYSRPTPIDSCQSFKGRCNKVRGARGSQQITEFGAALFLLIGCFLIPFVDLCVIPARYGLGKSVVSSVVHKLAQSETMSQALKAGSDYTVIQDTLRTLGGIDVKSVTVSLVLESTNITGETKIINRVGSIPQHLLPDGKGIPCFYFLNMKVNADIYPLVTVPLKSKIPGLTVPISMQFDESSAWENLARDPTTEEFYVNE